VLARARQGRHRGSPGQTAPCQQEVVSSQPPRRQPELPSLETERHHLITVLIIQQKSPRCIGHLEDFLVAQLSNFPIGQLSNLALGQVTNLCRSARAPASARLETPSLDRMLLTCALAVERLTLNLPAISGLLNPSTTSASTSCSRGVRSWPGEAGQCDDLYVGMSFADGPGGCRTRMGVGALIGLSSLLRDERRMTGAVSSFVVRHSSALHTTAICAPCPGSLSIANLAPTAWARSRMMHNPRRSGGTRLGSKPHLQPLPDTNAPGGRCFHHHQQRGSFCCS